MAGTTTPEHDGPVPPPTGADALREQLLALVLERGYTRRAEPFQLSSGGTSRDYVDLRRAVALGDDLRLGAEAVIAHVATLGVDFDVVGGMTMGADPVAHAVALLSGRAWFSVRKTEKQHGTRRRIEGGEVGPGVRVLLFEDTISTGRSILEALQVVRDAGAEVVLACTLLDRGDAVAASFAATGIRYSPILTYRDLGIAPIGAPSPAEGLGGDEHEQPGDGRALGDGGSDPG